MWEQKQAIELLSDLHQVALHETGYALNLGGSVLYKGGSDKDLDVVAIPSLAHEQNEMKLLGLFIAKGFNPQEACKMYGMNVTKMFNDAGQRLDLIVPKLACLQ